MMQHGVFLMTTMMKKTKRRICSSSNSRRINCQASSRGLVPSQAAGRSVNHSFLVSILPTDFHRRVAVDRLTATEIRENELLCLNVSRLADVIVNNSLR